MLIERVILRDFRNFADAELELGPRFTILHGHNGAGKTNVLEAIYLISTLRSFRASDTGTLLRHGCEAAVVEVVAHDPHTDLRRVLTVRIARTGNGNGIRRVASLDGKAVRSAQDFYGRIPAIVFTPEDLSILRGGPLGRRQFLDRMIFARERAHLADVQSYEKLLRSRNHVLKREDVDRVQRGDLLSVYEQGLADVGARIWTRRTTLLEKLAHPFATAFQQIHGDLGAIPDVQPGRPIAVNVRYASSLGSPPASDRPSVLHQALLARRPEDLRRKATTVGPHRDDIEVVLADQSAAEFASQGQSRALVLALKLAELRSFASDCGTSPLLLLDDVSSELDPRRSARLFELLSNDVGQCVLTTTEARYVTVSDPERARWCPVADGILRPVDRA